MMVVAGAMKVPCALVRGVFPDSDASEFTIAGSGSRKPHSSHCIVKPLESLISTAMQPG